VPASTSLTSRIRSPHGPLRRAVRRHRRPLAAVLAGIAVVLALTSLRPGADPVLPTTSGGATDVDRGRPGEVTVPVVLASGVIAALLEVGDVIDLVGAPTAGDATASVVARDARVVELPRGATALGASTAAVVLVALPEADALRVVTSMRDGLTPVIRSR
jgi:hypothetical protein